LKWVGDGKEGCGNSRDSEAVGSTDLVVEVPAVSDEVTGLSKAVRAA